MELNNPLFGLREYRRTRASREASREIHWSDYLEQVVQNKLLYAIIELEQAHGNAYDHSGQLCDFAGVINRTVRIVCAQHGILHLPGHEYRSSPRDELISTIVSNGVDRDIVFSLIEGIWLTTQTFKYRPVRAGLDPRNQFAENIRVILEDHRVAFDFIGGQFISRGDQALHKNVIVPALTLLSGRASFETPERRFAEALASIKDGRFDDAITDACGSLEATLGELGCDGNTLGKKFHHAINLGIATQYDKKIVDWLSSERVSKGDAHPDGPKATRADAWLSIHIAGALIVCLLEPGDRGTSSD